MTLHPPAAFDPARHRTETFACGREQLDLWLRAFAGQGQRRDASRTFVVADPEDQVAGYYTLVAAQAAHAEATPDVRRGMSKHFPIPVVLLARLAVDQRHQSRGLGAALLADAMRRTVEAADRVGIRAVVVDALDADAASFYRRYGFAALPGNELTLMATIARLRSAGG